MTPLASALHGPATVLFAKPRMQQGSVVQWIDGWMVLLYDVPAHIRTFLPHIMMRVCCVTGCNLFCGQCRVQVAKHLSSALSLLEDNLFGLLSACIRSRAANIEYSSRAARHPVCTSVGRYLVGGVGHRESATNDTGFFGCYQQSWGCNGNVCFQLFCVCQYFGHPFHQNSMFN